MWEGDTCHGAAAIKSVVAYCGDEVVENKGTYAIVPVVESNIGTKTVLALMQIKICRSQSCGGFVKYQPIGRVVVGVLKVVDVAGSDGGHMVAGEGLVEDAGLVAAAIEGGAIRVVVEQGGDGDGLEVGPCGQHDEETPGVGGADGLLKMEGDAVAAIGEAAEGRLASVVAPQLSLAAEHLVFNALHLNGLDIFVGIGERDFEECAEVAKAEFAVAGGAVGSHGVVDNLVTITLGILLNVGEVDGGHIVRNAVVGVEGEDVARDIVGKLNLCGAGTAFGARGDGDVVVGAVDFDDVGGFPAGIVFGIDICCRKARKWR